MGKIRLAAGQQLMDIRLMTNIKHQTVFIRIKHGLNGNRQLYDAQIGRQMAAGFGHTGNQKRTDLRTQKALLLRSEVLKVLMTANFL
jgi:hypothetical protein